MRASLEMRAYKRFASCSLDPFDAKCKYRFGTLKKATNKKETNSFVVNQVFIPIHSKLQNQTQSLFNQKHFS